MGIKEKALAWGSLDGPKKDSDSEAHKDASAYRRRLAEKQLQCDRAEWLFYMDSETGN